jgi:hypothetical protein
MNEQINQQSSPSIEYTYKLIKGGDNNTYVSVEPLMHDIELSIQKMCEMNIDQLSQENKQVFDLKILGLKTVFEFLGAIKMEQTLKEKAQELKGDVPLNTESNFTLTGASPSKAVH